MRYHLQGKGIPKNQLTPTICEQMMKRESIKIEMSRDFKRIHVNKNSNQKDYENFSILKLDALVKVINKNPWRGRHFYLNGSVPFGHSSI